MKKHKRHGSCLPCRNLSLGNLCGTSIDTDDIEFTSPRSNLVYIDKVFSFKEATSCPIVSCVNTGGMNAHNFIATIDIREPDKCDHDHHHDCNCGCACHTTCNCFCGTAINKSSVFDIERSFVVVEYFNTRPPGNAPCVSIEGFNVDAEFNNGQFMVNTDQVNSQVQRDRCENAGLPTKTFFLVNCAGPWDFRAKYVLEGTVNTDGKTFCFRAEISNAPGKPNSSLPNSELSSFAIPNLSIPCTINGIAPSILFQFNANIELIRPRLTVNAVNNHHPRPRGNNESECEESSRNIDCICICNNNGDDFTLSLTANLAVEPTIHVETVRKTLFCINACEALQPCDGSELAAEMEDEEDDTDPFAPDCSCGRNGVVSPIEDDCGCNNNIENTSRNNNCGCNTHRNNETRGTSQHSCNGCNW